MNHDPARQALRLGIRIPPCDPIVDTVEFIRQVEDEGFDIAWIPDSQLLWHDPWATIGAAASVTGRITLGTNVTNPITRHATVTASASVTAADLTGDRFVLGIGSGDSSVRLIGIETAKRSDLRDYVGAVRGLAAGEEVEFHGVSTRLVHGPAAVPIYLAATGPRMLQLAGEIADGVIFVGGVTPDALDYAQTNIGTGAARAGRRPDSVDLAVGFFSHLTDDLVRDRRLALPYAALFARRYGDIMSELDAQPPPDSAETDIYPDLGHAVDWDAAIVASEWVPDRVLDLFVQQYCVMGSAEQISTQVLDLVKRGFSNLYIRGLYSYERPETLARLFAHTVAPHVKQQLGVTPT